jgi:2-amino-4-hydroxy-6-hydroxymethyldihydropteridine diphosphokinase
MGDAAKTLRRAMTELQRLTPSPLLRSSLWRTTPVACPPGSALFVNAVVGWAPGAGETPESLLGRLQALERAFGRRPKQVVNEPRPLDLDLIMFGAETRHTPQLTLPHARAHRRRFVLQPLAEIAPDLILPGQTRPVATLLAALQSDEQVVRLPD